MNRDTDKKRERLKLPGIEDQERLERIKYSLQQIDALMKELKGLDKKKPEPKIEKTPARGKLRLVR